MSEDPVIVAPALAELAEVIGPTAALALSANFGGQEKCYIPSRPDQHHPWAAVIGWPAWCALCQEYGRQRLDIPRNAHAQSIKARVLKLKDQGLAHREIARRVRCTERYVRMTCNAGRAEDQRGLFD